MTDVNPVEQDARASDEATRGNGGVVGETPIWDAMTERLRRHGISTSEILDAAEQQWPGSVKRERQAR
jgi:hypothetical protein